MAVRDPRGDQALAILRVVIGIVFMAHGYQKFFMTGIPGVTSFFTQVGAPFPALSAPLVSTLELAGGAALVAGFFARPIAIRVTRKGLEAGLDATSDASAAGV